MADTFPLLDLPIDCIANVFGHMPFHDLYQIGKLPLGDARTVHTRAMDARGPNEAVVGIEGLRWRTLDHVNSGFNELISLTIHARVSTHRWRQPTQVQDITLIVNECTFDNVEMNYVTVIERNSCRIIILFRKNNHHRTNVIIPPYLLPMLEKVLPRLSGNGYKRYKDRRDRMISTIHLILEKIG